MLVRNLRTNMILDYWICRNNPHKIKVVNLIILYTNSIVKSDLTTLIQSTFYVTISVPIRLKIVS